MRAAKKSWPKRRQPRRKEILIRARRHAGEEFDTPVMRFRRVGTNRCRRGYEPDQIRLPGVPRSRLPTELYAGRCVRTRACRVETLSRRLCCGLVSVNLRAHRPSSKRVSTRHARVRHSFCHKADTSNLLYFGNPRHNNEQPLLCVCPSFSCLPAGGTGAIRHRHRRLLRST